jgi:hypothetical protein
MLHPAPQARTHPLTPPTNTHTLSLSLTHTPTHPHTRTHLPSPRTPGDAAQPLTTCAIWANDFALTGIAPGCKPTPMVTLNADPTLGTAFAVPSITGVTVA